MSELDALDEYTLSETDFTAKQESLPASDSTIEPHFSPDKKHFHNQRDPRYSILTEKATHLNICYMTIAGHTNKEIAELTGLHPVSVSNIIRQPWAQARIAEIIHKSGRSNVEQLLKGAAAKAVNRLIEEVDNCDKDAQGASAQSRISASKEILDRVFGKAAQPIIHTQVDLNKLSDAELAAMLPSTDGTTVNK